MMGWTDHGKVMLHCDHIIELDHRTIKYPELEKIHEDHWVQLLAPVLLIYSAGKNVKLLS